MNPQDTQSKYYFDLSQNLIAKAHKDGTIFAAEKRILDYYLIEKYNQGISPGRYYKITHYLLRIKRDCKISNLQTCDTAEIKTAFNKLKSLTVSPNGMQQIRGGSLDNRTLSQNTINDIQRALKSFFIWLADTRQNKIINAREIEKLKPVKQSLSTITEADLLTPDELKRFFESCKTPRDRALFHLLYSAALRVGEVCNLKIKDVITTQDNIIFIQTTGKTGIMRKIPIIDDETKQALTYWISTYRARAEQIATLFYGPKGGKMTPAAVSMQLKRIAKTAKIEKDLHPHIIRHTRITELCRMGLNEMYIKKIAWGHLNTNMIDVYTHLSPDDIADALIKLQTQSSH